MILKINPLKDEFLCVSGPKATVYSAVVTHSKIYKTSIHTYTSKIHWYTKVQS